MTQTATIKQVSEVSHAAISAEVSAMTSTWAPEARAKLAADLKTNRELRSFVQVMAGFNVIAKTAGAAHRTTCQCRDCEDDRTEKTWRKSGRPLPSPVR